jgi:hypothetical protein
MLTDHLSMNTTVVVTWDGNQKPVVRGSKTEGACVLLVESMGYRYLSIRGDGAATERLLASDAAQAVAAGAAVPGSSGGTPSVMDCAVETLAVPRSSNSSLSANSAPAWSTTHDAASAMTRAGAGAGAGTGAGAGAAAGVPAMTGAVILRQYPFTAERKMMSTLVVLDAANPDTSPVRLYITGASEIVLRHCTALLWPDAIDGSDERMATPSRRFGESPRKSRLVVNTPARMRHITEEVIEGMAKQSLRTLGCAYRDFANRSELPPCWRLDPDQWHGVPHAQALEEHLTFYGVLGIKDPLRSDVKHAIAECHRAGINVRMITGDNITTARAIARECGIIRSDDDIVIEGPVFRSLTPKQLDAIIPRLKVRCLLVILPHSSPPRFLTRVRSSCVCVCQVMARSSPRDKNMLVRRLNGNLPDNRETWEADHVGEEMTYDTPAELYTEVLGARVADVSDLRLRTDDAAPPTGMIQDVVLPGYVKEWEKSRLVRDDALSLLRCMWEHVHSLWTIAALAGEGQTAARGRGRHGRRHQRRTGAQGSGRRSVHGHHGHAGGQGRVRHRHPGRQLRVHRQGCHVGPRRLRYVHASDCWRRVAVAVAAVPRV